MALCFYSYMVKFRHANFLEIVIAIKNIKIVVNFGECEIS